MSVKILQSFAYYEEGNSYLARKDKDLSKSKDEYYKNFYTFLLSYLTIKKYAGPITMVCNKEAYDSLLKYIPYDDVKILENKRTFDFWSIYKVDAMKLIEGDVLHVDPDVMIFDRLFDPYLNDEEMDSMIQHKLSPHKNFNDEFAVRYEKELVELGILDVRRYDKGSNCTAVFGLREKYKEEYFNVVETIHDKMIAGEMHAYFNYHNPIVVEEFMWYLLTLKHNMNVHHVLPYDLVKKNDERKVGDMVKYTHLWLGTRFKDTIIKLVKNKIKTEFPEYVSYMEKFEADVYGKKIFA